MSDPNIKGVKRSSTRQAASAAATKKRSATGKTARPKPLVKRSASEKAPARKAAKARTTPSPVVKTAAKSKASKKPSKSAAPRKPVAKSARTTNQHRSRALPAARSSKSKVAKAAKAHAPQPKSAKTSGARKQSVPPVVRPQPTRDEAAALRAFERAHKEFTRGRFAEARTLFRTLVEQHAGVSEVTARARTYLAIAETRLRAEPTLPRDADSLYDRGVIELNRAEFVAAQELFERALKREPEAAHIHYGLAATRARLGSINPALESLQRALNLQPSLRVRAQHDQDLAALRNEPDFDSLIFASRS
jgi:tetratricopeptide (TPR) repeat protein